MLNYFKKYLILFSILFVNFKNKVYPKGLKINNTFLSNVNYEIIVLYILICLKFVIHFINY